MGASWEAAAECGSSVYYSTLSLLQHLTNTAFSPSFSPSFISQCDFLYPCRYQQVPVVLVGNKVDLEDEREVSPSEGQALAEDWGCPFMETSAKSKTMVDELFAEIVRQMDFCPLPDHRETCCPTCSIQ